MSEQASPIGFVDAGFGHWLAGLIDGEGSFLIGPRGSRWLTGFVLRLRADDRRVVELVHATTGIGNVHIHAASTSEARPNNRPSVTWTINSRAHKARFIEILDVYPLRSKKARDYAIWREAVLSGATAELALDLRRVREYRDDIDLVVEPTPRSQLSLECV